MEHLENRALLSALGFQVYGNHSFGGDGRVGGYTRGSTTQLASDIYIAIRSQSQVGVQTTVQLIALDANGRVVRGFDDTVNLTSTDKGATMPTSVTLQNGTASISVTFATAGQQTITATDTSTTNSTLTGAASTVVSAAPVASQYYVLLRPTVQAGNQTTIQIEALDANGYLVRNYDGTASIVNSDTSATNPATVTFQNGIASFTVTFATTGPQSITLTDKSNPALTAKVSTDVTAAATASQYAINVRPVVQSGTPVTIQVLAIDANGHIVQSYNGTATITSSDTKATLPTSPVTFKNGVATFQVTFSTTGEQSVIVTDDSTISPLPNATGYTDVVASLNPRPSPNPSPSPAPKPSPSPTSSSQPGNTTTSSNWSGYAAETKLSSPQSNAVTEVSGSWKVPTVTGSGNTFSAVWVGIDGYDSSSVEQIGTEQDIVNGKAEYSVWWEMYPAGSTAIASMTIKPGDSITASVEYITSGAHAGQFELTITDTSKTNDTFTTYQSGGNVDRSSAEWIVEAPASNNNILPLANFTTVQYTDATATINGVTGAIDNSAWQSIAINMGGGRGASTDTTSALTDSNGVSAFTVTFAGTGGSTRPGSGFSSNGNHKSNALVLASVGNSASSSQSQTLNDLSLRDRVFQSFDFNRS